MTSTTARRRAVALGVLVPLLTGGLLAAAGPAGAVPFEGDPGTTHCTRLLSWTELTRQPVTVDPDALRSSVPLLAVLVPLAEC
jgi:hypothetical protein